MLLLFLYGPAASGKLTVAREVEAMTGFPVFHNHLVIDMLTPLFEFGSAPFVDLRERTWLEVMGRAADEEIPGLVFTFTPERTVPHGFVERLTGRIEGAGGEVALVELRCPEEELENRMGAESRAAYGKVHTAELYRELRDSGAFDFPAITNARVTIDTSQLGPREAAELIVRSLVLSGNGGADSG